MNGQFEAKVAAWVEKVPGLLKAVRDEAASRVIENAQTPVAKGGNMPVVTGFLRASGRAVIGEALPLATRNTAGKDATFNYDSGAVSLVIATAKLEDTITFAWTANYAKYVEAKRKFQALAAQGWSRTVREVVSEVKAARR